MKRVFLSLGSNLGDREAFLREALDHLEASGIRVLRVSSLYETAPRDVTDQPAFLNIAAEAETGLFPIQLLHRTQAIEQAMGRRKLRPKGPRNIDIDILLYGDAAVATEALTIPHARMHERRFVLEPLAEIAPDLRHPITRRTIREMLGDVQNQVVRKIAAEGWAGSARRNSEPAS